MKYLEKLGTVQATKSMKHEVCLNLAMLMKMLETIEVGYSLQFTDDQRFCDLVPFNEINSLQLFKSYRN